MRRRLPMLIFALGLLLSGCGAILDRSYAQETPHPQYSDEDKASGYLRAENYRQLVSAILFLVAQGDEAGVIRLYDYTGAVESDLDAAYWEVIHLDPLGAYAVDYIKYELSKAVSYYEVELSDIVYRRSLDQIEAVTSVTGVSAIAGELGDVLEAVQEEVVYRVSYFEQGSTTEEIAAIAWRAYLESPATAVGRPQVAVELYPAESTGRQRMVEIMLTYPESPEVMRERMALLGTTLEELMLGCDMESAPQERLRWVQETLRQQVSWSDDPQKASTYSALVEGEGNPEGRVLAAAALCQGAGLDVQLIEGSFGDVPRIWIQVQVDGLWLHWDLSSEQAILVEEEALRGLGYSWSEAAVVQVLAADRQQNEAE